MIYTRLKRLRLLQTRKIKGEGGYKVGPLSEGKKRFKLSLDSLTYQTFKMLCLHKGYGHPSQVLELYMRACLKNPTLPLIIKRIVEGE